MIAFAPVHTITQPYDLREKIRRSASFPSGFGPLWCAPSALAVEHPGALEKNADCSTCHTQKMMGRSVHSAMTSPCTVCHVTNTQGDMTTVSLSMPKNKIYYAYHEESAALTQHVPAAVKGFCVECHDAHGSERRTLLHKESQLPPAALKKKEKVIVSPSRKCATALGHASQRALLARSPRPSRVSYEDGLRFAGPTK